MGLSLSAADYLQVLDWTGRRLAPGKRGTISGLALGIIERLDATHERCVARVRGYGDGWARISGSAQDLIEMAKRLGQRWLKGIGLAQRLT
ncbi:MAG TPA: hypothetical protein VLF18_00770 [Tahibacter sp.]|uniref:hypothetical protein n=1 Tax=Tahibacter sp. TaxID=2056211 RepID=UPI002C9776FD|nr:hypothetical protein [Tahibacter sp.]HSX58706.1 hypothetical protein [Tahibacter sp.]